MDQAELGRRADRNWQDTWRAVAPRQPEGEVIDEGGLLLASWGAPVAFFNAAWVTVDAATSEAGDAAAHVARAVAFYEERGLPFTLWARPGQEALTAAGEAAGLRRGDPLPGMALTPLPPPPPAPPGLEIRRVDDERTVADAITVLAAGFGMPEDLVAELTPMAVVDGVFTTLIGYVDGRPVASSAVTITGATAGVYNVATVEDHRRRGLGEAMTWAAVAAGAGAGADTAILQASPMGAPIYERMGFRLVVPYSPLTPPR